MVKPKAPFFGFGASGKIGDVLVFGSWKGIDVAREYVIPANPQSTGQTTQRGYFSDAVDEWHQVVVNGNGDDVEAWNRYAGVLTRMSGFNAFTREWVNELVAGGTPIGGMLDYAVTDTTANSMDLSIAVRNGNNEVVTARWGNSKTFFPYSDAAAMVGGVYTMAAEASNYPAGTRIYMYFTVGTAGVDFSRSGLYSILLT